MSRKTCKHEGATDQQPYSYKRTLLGEIICKYWCPLCGKRITTKDGVVQ